ncbi:MAG TPA: AAA family ATPase, partial [Opitutaceae bacterium]|nr:AAA family ATPase [Opitutaceae bacterium]
GAEWLGFTTRRRRILYVNFEIKPRNLWRRVHRIRAALGLAKTEDFRAWNLRGKGFNMDDHVDTLIAKAKEIDAAVIFLDPIYKLFGNRNESSAGDMATLMTLLDRLATETGAAVVFAHHYAKGSTAGKDAIDRASGSGVFARDPDCILTLTRLDEAEGKNTFTISATLREQPPVDDFAVRREHPIMVRADGVNVRNLHEPAKRLSKYTPEQVVGVLPATGATITEWQRLARQHLGMSKSTFFDTYAQPAKKLARFTTGLWFRSDRSD